MTASVPGREVELEMGLTPAEFRRLLPAALEGRPWQEAEGRLLVQDPGWNLSIEVEARPPRRIALLQVPVTRVRMRFAGAGTGVDRFLQRFYLHYQRGGG